MTTPASLKSSVEVICTFARTYLGPRRVGSEPAVKEGQREKGNKRTKERERRVHGEDSCVEEGTREEEEGRDALRSV